MATTKIPAEFLSTNAIQGTLIADNAITTVHIAQNAITSVQIPNNSIGTVQIALNTVTGVHIAQNSVTTVQLATNSVNTLNIADDQVTADKLASGAVVTASIVDLNVTEGKIAANSITATKIPDGSITATQLGANSVTLAKMASLARGSILLGNSAADVSALAIGSNGYVLKSDGTDAAWAAEQSIAANSVTSGMIASNSILTRHIDDDQVTGDQLADTITVVTSVVTPLVDAAVVDGENFKVNGGQGSDGQVLTSTGSGVAWEDASGGSFDPDGAVVFNESGAAVDFRVEGDTFTHLLFGDASTDRIGINTSTPAGPLHISGTGSQGGDGVHMIIQNVEAGGSPAGIRLLSDHGNWEVVNSKTIGDALEFIDDSAGATRMHIDSAGKVHIGNTFSADGSYDNLVVGTGAGNEGLTIYGAANGASSIAFADPNDNDVGNIMYDHSSNFMKFVTNAGERMRIDSSGRVGINRTPAISSSKLEIGGADDTQLIVLEASGYTGGLGIGATGLQFFTESTVRGKFDSTGEFLVNRTNGFGTGGAAAMFVTGRSDAGIYVTGPNTSGYALMSFLNGGLNGIGSIKNLNNNALTFYSNSDYRLKENVDYTWDATTRLKQLKPARFNWISDDSNTTVDGFLAHEVSSIVPDAVDGVKDATKTSTNCVLNSEGNLQTAGVTEAEWTAGKEDSTYESDTSWAASHTQDVYQAIDESKLIPLLVKTIQELEARITTLEG